MLFVKSNRRILATLLVKNEADIIKKTIEHHLENGVSDFLVTDNNSTDDTVNILGGYPEVREILSTADDTHNQAVHVNHMARLACKFNPEWIIHLDGDELWCGLGNLRKINSDRVASIRCFLHPPGSDMRKYLDFSKTGIPDESKVAHRPGIEGITHGNHGFLSGDVYYTTDIWRHHYPVRSYEQFVRKACGHLALQKGTAPVLAGRNGIKCIVQAICLQNMKKL